MTKTDLQYPGHRHRECVRCGRVFDGWWAGLALPAHACDDDEEASTWDTS